MLYGICSFFFFFAKEFLNFGREILEHSVYFSISYMWLPTELAVSHINLNNLSQNLLNFNSMKLQIVLYFNSCCKGWQIS